MESSLNHDESNSLPLIGHSLEESTGKAKFVQNQQKSTKTPNTQNQEKQDALPKILQKVSVLKPLTPKPLISNISYSSKSIQKSTDKTQKSKLSKTNTTSTTKVNSQWSSFNELVGGQTTPTRGLRNNVARKTNSSSNIQTKSFHPAQVQVSRKVASGNITDKNISESTRNQSLELLAQAVYTQLKQRLRVEKERHGRGYDGRINW